MKIAVLITTWNGRDYIGACLESVLAQQPCSTVILIVDNNSQDDTLSIAQSFMDKAKVCGTKLELVHNSENLGFTRATNIGLRLLLSGFGSCEMTVLLNQDTTVKAGWLKALEEAFQTHPAAGAVGCKILYPDGVFIQHAGGFLLFPRMAGEHFGHHQEDRGGFDAPRDVDFVTGAAMAVRLASLKAVGVFDEIFSPGYYEDVDLCARLKASGWRVLYWPQAVVTHIESASFSRDRAKMLALSHRNRILFAARRMGDPEFRRQFAEAERAYTRNEASNEDLRALALAYGLALIALPAAMHADGPDNAAWKLEIIGLLADLRQVCLRLRRGDGANTCKASLAPDKA